MRLYLVQHGDALPEQVDPERPLSAEGRRDVEVARLLASAGTRAVRVAHSGKLRAQQTAEVLAAAALPQSGDHDGSQPQRSGRARGAGRGLTSDTILVGHLPFMGRLVARLVAGHERGPDAFVPGSVVCLEQAEAGGWAITWMVIPELAPPLG